MLWVVESRKFLHSLERVSQYRNFDRAALERIVDQLRANKVLEARHRDHNLKGDYTGIRECHIKNDLLLLYKKRNDVLILLLVDIGTHASVFRK